MLRTFGSMEFARYKYSFYEYLYYFMREAQQTPSKDREAAGRRIFAIPAGTATGGFQGFKKIKFFLCLLNRPTSWRPI
jgi:transposase